MAVVAPRTLLLACLGCLAAAPGAVWALASAPGGGGTAQSCPSALSTSAINPEMAAQRIRSGRVYSHPHFLSEEQLQLLQRDMGRLRDEGKFVVNGLSDVRRGLKGEPTSSSSSGKAAAQGFDVRYDRSVCPIPWWKEALSIEEDDGSKLVSSDDEEEKLLRSIQAKLQRLRRDISETLGRPSMMNHELGHECYYSQSAPGSSLARHMDERHEETKGPRGWLLPSRRSVSWLIYLSEADDETASGGSAEWDAEANGGMLRTFPQKHYRSNSDDGAEDTVECGSHNGNLQVGWLVAGRGEKGKQSTHPVFLDSWFDHINPYMGTPEPHCILYTVRKPPGSAEMRVEYITAPWSIDAIEGNLADFLQRQAGVESAPTFDPSSSPSLFLQTAYARQFQLLEDRDAWERGEMPAGSLVEDFAPTRGTLVAFDSVALPHEVTAVIRGRRAALAGWFHEETQPLGGGK